jgi:predicted small metal-binding protein
MSKSLSCKNLGDLECSWEGKAETEEELLEVALAHGREAHDITEVSEELLGEMKAAIRDE